MVETLHPRRLGILRYVAGRQARGEPAPSVKEIASAVGLSSTQTVHHHLQKLRGEGLLERDAGWAKMLRVTERGWRVLGEGSLMGRAAAGAGLEAIADEEAYSIAGELLLSRSGRQRYLLRVEGGSMVGAGIGDGDLLVVEEDHDPPDGTIVVALFSSGEVTVKRLYRQVEEVYLKAESEEHQDIVCRRGEVEVQGRVVAAIKSFG